MSEETQQQQMFLAKALYDNIAETPDELAFRRGDVITILEQDTGGLDGWWLCSLRGRQGIAPGNRLKILSGMMEGVGKGSPLTEHDASKTEWRRSMEKSPSQVVTPVKKGDVYDHPNRSMEDYDVPPSRYFPASKDSSPQPGGEIYDVPTNLPAVPADSSFYDTPPSSKRASCERTPSGSQRASMDSLSSTSSLSHRLSGDQLQQHVYQTPPSSKRSSAESGSLRFSGGERHYETPPGSKRASLERILSDDQPNYDTPSGRPVEAVREVNYDFPIPSSRRHSRDSLGTGNRGSVLSTASSESVSGSSSNLVHIRNSNTVSLSDSARSSLDASLHEPYDLPPRETRALKQLSMDSGLGSFYDTPGPGRQSQMSGQPTHFTRSSSRLSDCTMKGEKRSHIDIKRSRSLENALDDFYESPRSNAPKVGLKSTVPTFGSTSAVNHDSNAVYDIPPQVTRDSVISARSDSSDDSQRLSSCSMDSRGSGAEYAALAEGVYEELLLDLDSAVELLVKLQQNVIRSASRVLTFVSSTWRTKESLQSSVYDIKVACIDLKKTMSEFMEFAQGTLANTARLSDRKLVSRLIKQVTPLQQQRKTISTSLRALEDMKWQVALLSEPAETDTEDYLGTIISLAQDLIPEVKKLASLIQGNSTLIFKRSSDMAGAGSGSGRAASKPPIGPKPDMYLKPSIGGGSGVGVVIPRARTLQQRPLPAPPVSNRPLPPTPLEQKLRSLDKSGSQDSLNDYVNVEDGMRRCVVADDDDDDGDRDYSVLQQEYDYVQLETRDVEAQQQSIDQQQQSSQQQPGLNNIKEESEPPNTPLIEKTQSCDSVSVCSKEDVCSDTMPDPAPNTEKMSADVDEKHSDIDTIPTKDSCEMISPEGKDIPDGLDVSEPDSLEDLKTPMNPVNGFNMPNYPPSSSFDFSGTSLDPNDKQVLCYYTGQLETHSTLLTNAIDAFFNCIENNEPPNVFISNSKFVIITAHKLVYISDALHRSLMNSEVRNKIMHCANHVCECLKVSVQATKTAALQYPSVPAVQDMVDRVVDVSHAAHELKLIITQASTL